mmetsp:Transcript_33426/g.42930  ORF Transcript_33426/g.42930 Transcript_33426/m.42930 type:complete len:82 (-) Transcript_33426:244-489(-)
MSDTRNAPTQNISEGLCLLRLNTSSVEMVNRLSGKVSTPVQSRICEETTIWDAGENQPGHPTAHPVPGMAFQAEPVGTTKG